MRLGFVLIAWQKWLHELIVHLPPTQMAFFLEWDVIWIRTSLSYFHIYNCFLCLLLISACFIPNAGCDNFFLLKTSAISLNWEFQTKALQTTRLFFLKRTKQWIFSRDADSRGYTKLQHFCEGSSTRKVEIVELWSAPISRIILKRLRADLTFINPGLVQIEFNLKTTIIYHAWLSKLTICLPNKDTFDLGRVLSV